MKKNLLLLSVVAMMVFAGCSSDDDNNNDGDGPGTGALVKKIEFDYVDDDYTDVIQFTYNGNKLVKGVYTDGYEDRFFYTGDRITKIEYVTDTGEVQARELFTYDSEGMLTEYRFLELDWDYEEKSTFEVTGTNTVLETYYSGTIDSPSEDWTAVLTMSNGEVIQKVQTGWDGDTTYTYTYDTKNSPFKNVTGYGAIAYVAAGDHEIEGFSRNILSIHNDTDGINYTVNTFTYNSDNYPSTLNSVGYFDGDETTYTMNATFFYE